MALLDDIRNHLAVMNPGQRERRGAVLLREAAAEIERLSAITPSESDSPQPVASTPAEPSTPGEGTRQAGCTLTDAEREAIEWAAYAAEQWYEHNAAATLRGLLERTSTKSDTRP